mgnify:CR=1 FL=1
MNIPTRKQDDDLMMEGLFSRAKARVAGAAGTARDAAQRGAGQVQSAVGKAASSVGIKNVGADLQQSGKENIEGGQGGGDAAKKKSIQASIINGVVADLTKLGLDGDPAVVSNIKEELMAVFDLFLKPPFEADAPKSDTSDTSAV